MFTTLTPILQIEYLASPEHTKQIYADNHVLSFEHGVATVRELFNSVSLLYR